MGKMKKQLLQLIRIGLPALLLAVAPATVLAVDNFGALAGRWQRTDGGYIIDIRSVDDKGKMEVGYFNPNPINVSKAQAFEEKGKITIEVELRDVGYPGSTYKLMYMSGKDTLFGYYYHAVSGQYFDVLFKRTK